MAAPRRYTLCLEVDVRDQESRGSLGEPETVMARCDQLRHEVRGGSDAEALCNLLRLGLREGWATQEQIQAIVGRALATKRKLRR